MTVYGPLKFTVMVPSGLKDYESYGYKIDGFGYPARGIILEW